MTRVRYRKDVIDLIALWTYYPAVKRAIAEGRRVEFFGGFTFVEGRSGWIVRVTARHGTVYVLSLIPGNQPRQWHVHRHGDVPWHLWDGPTGNPLYDGDNPDAALEYRAAALATDSAAGPD